MTALQSQDLGGPADIAVIFIQLFQNIVAFVGGTGLVKSRSLRPGGSAASIAVDKRRKMFALETGGGGVHDDDTLDDVAEFADVAGPRITHECGNRIVGNFTHTTTV